MGFRSLAGQMFGIAVRIYMVKISCSAEAFRRSLKCRPQGAESVRQPDRYNRGRPQALALDREKILVARMPSRKRWRKPPRAPIPLYGLGRCSTMSSCTRPSSDWEAEKPAVHKDRPLPGRDPRPCGGSFVVRRHRLPFLADKGGGRPARTGTCAALPSGRPRRLTLGPLCLRLWRLPPATRR